MKFWENPLKEKMIQGCICDKESETIKVMPEIAKRNIMYLTLGIIVLLGATISVGLDDVRAWALIGVELLFFAPITIAIVRLTKRGHSLKCAIRRASYTTF